MDADRIKGFQISPDTDYFYRDGKKELHSYLLVQSSQNARRFKKKGWVDPYMANEEISVVLGTDTNEPTHFQVLPLDEIKDAGSTFAGGFSAARFAKSGGFKSFQQDFQDCHVVAVIDAIERNEVALSQLVDLNQDVDSMAAVPFHVSFGIRRFVVYVDWRAAATDKKHLAGARCSKKKIRLPALVERLVAKCLGGHSVLEEGGYATTIMALLTTGFALFVYVKEIAWEELLLKLILAFRSGKLVVCSTFMLPNDVDPKDVVYAELCDNHYLSCLQIIPCLYKGVKDALLIANTVHNVPLKGALHPSGDEYVDLDPYSQSVLPSALSETGIIALRVSQIHFRVDRFEIGTPRLPVLPTPCQNPSRIKDRGLWKLVWVFPGETGPSEAKALQARHTIKVPPGSTNLEVICYERWMGLKPWAKMGILVYEGAKLLYTAIGRSHASLDEWLMGGKTLNLQARSDESVGYNIVAIVTLDPDIEPDPLGSFWDTCYKEVVVEKADEAVNNGDNKDQPKQKKTRNK